MVSCGRDNIRLWRVRNGTLRSCPVDLGEYRSLDFSDVTFEEGNAPHKHVDDRTLWVNTKSQRFHLIDLNLLGINSFRPLVGLPAVGVGIFLRSIIVEFLLKMWGGCYLHNSSTPAAGRSGLLTQVGWNQVSQKHILVILRETLILNCLNTCFLSYWRHI